jgi:hypothetical protein
LCVREVRQLMGWRFCLKLHASWRLPGAEVGQMVVVSLVRIPTCSRMVSLISHMLACTHAIPST